MLSADLVPPHVASLVLIISLVSFANTPCDIISLPLCLSEVILLLIYHTATSTTLNKLTSLLTPSLTLSTLQVLPDICRAVAGRVEVYVDGGITRGTDVIKALALGAKAVFIGRPVLW